MTSRKKRRYLSKKSVQTLAACLFPLLCSATQPSSGAHPAVNYRLGEFYGGDFTLTDHNRNLFSLKDVRGKVTLINFGFTYCADICPTTLAKLSETLQLLGPISKQVQVLFITLDTKRDTPEVLRNYLTYFDKNILGLTGTQDEVEAVARQYRTPVKVRKPDQNGYYVVDHGSRIYFIGRDGMLASIMFYESSSNEMANKIKILLDE